MAFILDSKKIQKGDIILAKFDDTTSIRIRSILGSDFSHALMYLGNHSFIEADTQGVELFSSNRYVFKDPNSISLRRLKPEHISFTDTIANNARKYSFRDYNMEAVKDIYRAKKHNSTISDEENFDENGEWLKSLFCSQLIGVVYKESGINLFEEVSMNQFSLYEIENSDVLIKIEDFLIEIPEIAINQFTIYGEDDLPENVLTMQRELGKIISNKIKEEYKQNNFSIPVDFLYAIDRLITLNPKEIPIADEIISRNLKESGYLEIWKENRRLSPNLYNPFLLAENFNLDNFAEMQKAIDLLNDTLSCIQETIDFQEKNLIATRNNFEIVPLETYKVLAEMYENFINDLNTAKECVSVALKPLELIEGIMIKFNR